jgi:hypothetical protein
VYTLDTNAILYYLNGDQQVAALLGQQFEENAPLYVSAITEAELFRYPKLKAKEAIDIDSFLKIITLLPIDSRIARLAGSIGRTSGVKLADSIVAATALTTGSTLLTRNVKDFKSVPDLMVMEV